MSTNGGASFTTMASAIDPAGLDPGPIRLAFAADGVDDVVIRISENNAFDQLRLNGFAVPEPGRAVQLVSGLIALLGLRRWRLRT